ncbi:hypothetical protein KR222_005703, partial [Zaprionus bogoriensis]
TTLLTLNADCLDNIFQYFQLEELMSLYNNVHCVIDEAIERQLHRFRHYEFSMRFPPPHNGQLLQALGRQLQSLNINVGYSTRPQQLLQLLQQLLLGAAQSGRLRALKIQHAYFTAEYVQVLLPIAATLQELDLSICEVKQQQQLELLLQASTQLQLLCLNNKDADKLQCRLLLDRLQCLKINWIIGTELFDVTALSQQHPALSIVV